MLRRRCCTWKRHCNVRTAQKGRGPSNLHIEPSKEKLRFQQKAFRFRRPSVPSSRVQERDRTAGRREQRVAGPAPGEGGPAESGPAHRRLHAGDLRAGDGWDFGFVPDWVCSQEKQRSPFFVVVFLCDGHGTQMRLGFVWLGRGDQAASSDL